jgi:putative oxidoreductase
MPGAFARLDSALARTTAALSTLLARLVFGFAFFRTGLGKFQNFDATTSSFASFGFPVPSASAGLAATTELLGGLCLMIGFGTRIAAFFLGCTMIVAICMVHGGDVSAILKGRGGDKGLTDVTAVVFLVVMMLLMTTGAGPVSADHYLKKRQSKE